MRAIISLILIKIVFLVKANAFLWDTFNIERLFHNRTNIFNDLKQKIETSDDQQCLAQFEFFVSELVDEREWAIRVLDSWGKMPSGITSGNNVDLGHYDQCLASDTSYISSIETIETHYCQITVQDTSNRRNTSFTMAICAPSTCSQRFTGMIMEKFLENINYGLVKDKPLICPAGKPDRFGLIQWATVVFLFVIVWLLLFSTTYDLRTRRNGKQPNRLCTSFSIASNIKRLLKIHPNRGGGQFFNCFDGIRVLMIGWVVLIHSFQYDWLIPAIYDRSFSSRFRKTWGYPFIWHGDVAVETFFVIVGLLISYNFLKAREKNESFNILKYYIHRFFRIAPAYYAGILFMVAFIHYFGNGPSYSQVTEEWVRGNCVKYWWTALIFIQNWYPSSDSICITPTWYIQVDAQLFLLSPVFLYLFVKFKKHCLYIFGAIALASSASVITFTYINEITWYNYLGEKFEIYDPLIFYQTQHRIGSWLVGLLLGYYLFVTRGQQLSLSNKTIRILWHLVVVVMVLIIWLPWYFYVNNGDDVIFFALYQGLHRLSWSIATAWVITACVKGHGGALNWFLSLEMWQPLSKLTYSIFIIHQPIMTMTKLMQRTPDYLSPYQRFIYFLSIYSFSVLLAIPWTLSFEIPFIQAETELWKLKNKKREVNNA